METTENPTPSKTPSRRSAQERARLISEFTASGQSRVEFCNEHDIHPTTFSGWLKRKERSEQPVFKRVDIAGGLSSAVEIVLSNGIRIRLGHSSPIADLVELARGLSSC